MKINPLATLALSLCLAILGVVGYKLAPTAPADGLTRVAPIACNPGQGRCTSPLPGGGLLELSLAPQPIRPLQQQDIELTLRGLDAGTVEEVSVEFSGREMDMGTLRSRLRLGDGDVSHHYRGQVMLPVCVTGSMTWAATVLISGKQGGVAVPFHFEVAGR